MGTLQFLRTMTTRKAIIAVLVSSALLGVLSAENLGEYEFFEAHQEGASVPRSTLLQTVEFKKAFSTVSKIDSNIAKHISQMVSMGGRKVDYPAKHKAMVTKHKNDKSNGSLAALLKKISEKVVDDYNAHFKQTEDKVKTLDTELKVITTQQFRKVTDKAHAWCGKWERQQRDKQNQKDKLDERTTAQDQTATVKWKFDAQGGLDCDYVNPATSKPWTGARKTTCNPKTFSPSASFKQKWNNARNNFLRKDKAFYDAKQTHKSSIQQSNLAAKGFKDKINSLVDLKVNECDVSRKTGVLADVKEFNDENAKRATLYRSIKVIACHVQSMDKKQASKSLNNSNLKKCISTLPSEGDLKKTKFKDIATPIKFCPTKQEYRAKLKKMHSLNLHYTGNTEAIVTDSNGDVSNKFGWYPRKQQCADVKKKHVQQCKDYQDKCGVGKVYNAAAADTFTTEGQAPTKCCKTAAYTLVAKHTICHASAKSMVTTQPTLDACARTCKTKTKYFDYGYLIKGDPANSRCWKNGCTCICEQGTTCPQFHHLGYNLYKMY